MKKLSRFDISCIIAFVVITLAGGGAWYYLSGQLDAAKGDVANAAGDFDKYSKKQPYLPTPANERVLKENIATLQARLDPLVKVMEAPGNKLPGVTKEDTVTWKHELDADVGRLNDAAKVRGVNVPKNFYYSFSRYLNTNPTDEYTVVLLKQLLGVEEIANILINAPVQSIGSFRRTYEESAGGGAQATDKDALSGHAEMAPGGVYISYPFEIQFACNATAFRKVVNGLQSSPYIFIIRSLTVRNTSTTSPQKGDLDKLAAVPGAQPISLTDQSPGAVGTVAPHAPRGPQFLFGNELIEVKMRVDLIEWKGMAQSGQTNNVQGGHGRGRGGRGGRGGNGGGNGGNGGGGYGGQRRGDNE